MLWKVEGIAWFGVVALSMACVSIVRGDDSTLADGLKALQGTWTAPSSGLGEIVYTFKGETLTIVSPKRSYTMKVATDTKARPARSIDFAIVEGPDDAKGKNSKGIYEIVGDRLILCFSTEGDRPARFEQVGVEQFLVELTRKPDGPAPVAKVEPAAVDADAPLPEGWPGGTKPGTIEVKTYPAYRSAVARSKDTRAMEMSGLFFPLFAHIQSRNIAMTTPVVMGYETRLFEDEKARGEASMEFLYRRPDQGTAGPGLGAIKVEDHPAATFVCIGLQGRMDPQLARQARERLREWLADHKAEWVEAGEARMLGYHGPGTPTDRQLWEVQFPIKPAVDKGAAK